MSRAAADSDSPVLDRRTLNRTLLARQHLLAPAPVCAEAMIEHLVGMQAQEPQAPYVGLWNRIEGFEPEQLSDLIVERRAVRGGLMRSTVHLVTAGDYRLLWPLMSTVLAGAFRGSQFRKAIAAVSTEDVVDAGRTLIDEQPRTRAELRSLLAERWPEIDPTSLAYTVSSLTPLVQVPPRGVWRRSGQARLATADKWLGCKLREQPSRGTREQVVRRYLAAFGPATVKDVQAWCGLTGLRAVVEGMRNELRTFCDERGGELIDVAGAPLVDAGTAAPPRILAPFDNVILGHGDRSRIIATEHRGVLFGDRLMRAFLIDGFVAGTWRLDGDRIAFEHISRVSKADRAALGEQAERLRDFLVGAQR
jgi:hypothetical protein